MSHVYAYERERESDREKKRKKDRKCLSRCRIFVYILNRHSFTKGRTIWFLGFIILVLLFSPKTQQAGASGTIEIYVYNIYYWEPV
jgi:hypothetical protein